jgi:hypothetical protein
MAPCAVDALNPGVITMKQAIQSLIRNTFGAQRKAAAVAPLRTLAREELRAVVGGETTPLPKGTWK